MNHTTKTIRLLSLVASVLLLAVPVFAAVPAAPQELATFYGLNPDYPDTFTGEPDVTLTWTHPDMGSIKEWKILKKEWGEQKWTTVKNSDPKVPGFHDKGALASSPMVSYQIAAITESGTSKYASVTAWRLKRHYSDTPSWSWPKAEIWITNQPGGTRSLSVAKNGESRLCLKETAQWVQLAGEIDGIVLYFSTMQEAKVEDLRAFARALEANSKRGRIKVGIEIGCFVASKIREGNPPGSSAGEASFGIHEKAIRKYIDPVEKGGAGGVIDLVFIDGPIHRSVYPRSGNSPLTIETASEQTVRWMECFRKVSPNTKFNLICNFSSWYYAGVPARNSRSHAHGPNGFGDYDEVIDVLLPLAASRGIPFEGVTTDYAYDGFNNEGPTDQKAVVAGQDFRTRLRILRDKVTSLKLGPDGAHLQFGMLCNTSRGTGTSNYATRVELLNYMEEVNALGIIPDRITVQSWIRYPDRWLPETSKDSMTNITLRIFNRLRYQRDITTDNLP